MVFGMDRGRRPPWSVGLALTAMGCVSASPPPPVMGRDNLQCTVKAEVTLARLDDGTAPVVDPALLRSLYPDRARRMMIDGAATYACHREAERTLCVLESVEPMGVSFEHLDQSLAKLVAPAKGETWRLSLTFKILERGPCDFQIAPAAPARS